jgi:hypothetical protein
LTSLKKKMITIKRKSQSSLEYSHLRGSVNFRQFDKAVKEFVSREERGGDSEGEARVLLAEDVSLKKWISSGINERMRHVFVEATYKSGSVFSESTIADLWIVKVPNSKAYGIVVAEISCMLVTYRNIHGPMLSVGGGNQFLLGCTRRPDTAVSPKEIPVILAGQSSLPRLIFEVECGHRSVRNAHQRCLEFFELIPCLQAVVLFVVFGKRSDGTFAALALRYRRGPAAPAIEDAVSFGTAAQPIYPTSRSPAS